MAKHGKAVETKTVNRTVYWVLLVAVVTAFGILLFAGMDQNIKAVSPTVGGQVSTGNFNEDARVSPGRVKTADNQFECHNGTTKVEYLYVADQTFNMVTDIMNSVEREMCVLNDAAEYMEAAGLVLLFGDAGMGESVMLDAEYVTSLRVTK